MTMSALTTPKSIAVVGASASRPTLGGRILQCLQDFGFEGSLHAVHPSATSLNGIPAVTTLADVPGGVDCCYVARPASQVPEFIDVNGPHARFMQVSSGFSEVGAEALEAQLVGAARRAGVRLVGPNSLGTYCPRGRVSFIDGAPTEAGSVAFISQSGGLATDMIRRGGNRGLRFSHVISIGNGADASVEEALQFSAYDNATKVIAVYVESLSNGPMFLEALSNSMPEKPVVVLRGGLSEEGRRSASSHTGAMATPGRRWAGVIEQYGAVPVATVSDLIDVLVALQHPAARVLRGGRLLLFGPGGGASVLAADHASNEGFHLPPVSPAVQDRLRDNGLGAGSALANPLDTPAGVLAVGAEKLAESLDVLEHEVSPDVLVLHLNLHPFLAYTDDSAGLLTGVMDALGSQSRVGTYRSLVLRSTREEQTEDLRRRLLTRAVELGIPSFDELEDALRALGKVRDQTPWNSRQSMA